MVQKGQLLFELDPRPFQVALDATLADAKALDAQRIAAERDVARQKELLKSQAVAVSDYEKALADAHSYTARIAAKNQEAEKFRLDLEYSRVTAAISGRIGRAMLTEGNLVNAGGSDPLLATIVAVNPIYVDFNIDERALQVYQAIAAAWQAKEEQGAEKSLRELNLPFSFGLETESGFPHQGRLLFAENKVAADTGTIFVRGEAANRDRRLVPGFRVRVRLAVGDKYTATLVPEIAVNTEQTKKYLLMVGPDKIVKRQDVELGRLLDDGMRVVKAPKLSADALIVIEGMAREHYPVEPVLPSGATAK
jgi:RND family efflux transporter MFP subunit